MKKLIAISLIAFTATCAFARHHHPHHVILPPHVPHFMPAYSMPVQQCAWMPGYYATRVWEPGYYVQRMKMGVPVMVWVPGHWKVI